MEYYFMPAHLLGRSFDIWAAMARFMPTSKSSPPAPRHFHDDAAIDNTQNAVMDAEAAMPSVLR